MTPGTKRRSLRMTQPRRAGLAILMLLGIAPLATHPASAGSCVPSPTTLCLGSERYQVGVDWQSAQASGEGQVFPVATSNAGFFTFEDPTQVELLAKVIDGCAVNGSSWVFLADLSALGLAIDTADTASGAVSAYNLSLGAISRPIADTAALSCPAAASRQDGSRQHEAVPAARLARGSFGELPLIGGRFRVSMAWENGEGIAGMGTPIPLTDSSGAFWYTDPASPDRLLKIEPVPQTGFYRFVSGAPTDIRQTITVVDACTGSTRIYDQLPGLLLTIVDPRMHPIFCADQILFDGFESGDLSGWTSSIP